jgi:hypothetical protein
MAEKSTNGSMNTPAAIDTSIRASIPAMSDSLYVMRITMALLKKLSLKAPRNMVRKRGVNFRDLKRANWLPFKARFILPLVP